MNKTTERVVAPMGIRCTHASYEAITGNVWEGETIATGACLLEALNDAGWTFNPADEHDDIKTMRDIAKNVPAGSWYVYTSGHAMALVDGVLTDTEGNGFDGRRVKGMFRMFQR